MSRGAIATRAWCFFIFTAVYLLPAMCRTHLLSVVALVLFVTANRIPKYYHVLIKISSAVMLPNYEFVEILEQLTSAKKNPSAQSFSPVTFRNLKITSKKPIIFLSPEFRNESDYRNEIYRRKAAECKVLWFHKNEAIYLTPVINCHKTFHLNVHWPGLKSLRNCINDVFRLLTASELRSCKKVKVDLLGFPMRKCMCVFVVIELLCLERVGDWGKGRGRDRGYFSTKTVNMLGSCFARYLWF